MEVGSFCKKIAGREAGRYCVITSIEGKFANITGVRKYGMCGTRKCNLKHLIPTQFKIAIKSTKPEDVEKEIYSSGILTKMSLKKDRRDKYTRIINLKKKAEKKDVKKAPAKAVKKAKKEAKGNKSEKIAKAPVKKPKAASSSKEVTPTAKQ